MAKRRRGPGGGMPSGGMGGMMAQLQQMQADMEKAQKELESETVEVSVGGGALTIVITGHQRVQSININPDVVDVEDEDWATDLQDLLLAGMNQAIEAEDRRGTFLNAVPFGLLALIGAALGGYGLASQFGMIQSDQTLESPMSVYMPPFLIVLGVLLFAVMAYYFVRSLSSQD